MQNTLVLELNIQEAKALKSKLLELGWNEQEAGSEYVSLQMKSPAGSVCTLYTSRKAVFQGKDDFQKISEEIVGEGEEGVITFLPHIGVDEVGKGDYFGPLVVASCYMDEEFFKTAKSIGVGDSKKFSDGKIMKMYEQLKGYEYYYTSIVKPSEYNRLIGEIGNVNILLAKQHSLVIEKALVDLKAKNIHCNSVVIDQFSSVESRVKRELGNLGSNVNFRQFHKGESDLAVACASILARGIFLEEMEKMSEEYYFKFPKGASHVIDQAREFVAKHGVGELGKVAKVSFKTTKKVLDN